MTKKSHFHRKPHAKLKADADHIADDLNAMELSSLITNGRSLTAGERTAAIKSILEATPQEHRELDSMKQSLKSLTP